MPLRRVVVVAETQSLAGSIRDLLHSTGIPTDLLDPLEALETLGERAGPVGPSLLVVASNGRQSETARRWIHGDFPGSAIVVVGSRDPALARAPHIPTVPLPLRPDALVTLIQQRMTAR